MAGTSRHLSSRQPRPTAISGANGSTFVRVTQVHCAEDWEASLSIVLPLLLIAIAEALP